MVTKYKSPTLFVILTKSGILMLSEKYNPIKLLSELKFFKCTSNNNDFTSCKLWGNILEKSILLKSRANIRIPTNKVHQLIKEDIIFSFIPWLIIDFIMNNWKASILVFNKTVVSETAIFIGFILFRQESILLL